MTKGVSPADGRLVIFRIEIRFMARIQTSNKLWSSDINWDEITCKVQLPMTIQVEN